MNNNLNNNYNFDPMTGQPINHQQSVHPQQPKKNNKIFITIAIIVVISIIVVIFLFSNLDKKESTNNEAPNNSTVENNNSTDNGEEGTNTSYDENDTFLFSIEQVFTFSDKGTVVIGSVQKGKIKVGDVVQTIGLNQEILTAEVIGIEIFGQQKEEATVGDNAEILLKDDIIRGEIQIGQFLSKSNSIVAPTKFDADVYILSKEEGGRHTPFFDRYRPKFDFGTTNITGVIDLPDNIVKVNPGEEVSFTITLVSNIALEVGTEFSIREGGRIIGRGKVTKVY